MKRIILYFVSSISLIFCVNFSYGQIIYISGYPGIAKCDISNCTFTFIGNTTRLFVDIAFTPNGKLYGIADNGLYLIDTINASTQYIGLTHGFPNALVAIDDQYLLSADLGGNIYKISTNDAQTFFLGRGQPSAGDLTFYKGSLYFSAQNSNLYEIKINSNFNHIDSFICIGNMGSSMGMATIGYVNCIKSNRMIAFIGGRIYEVNPANAQINLICNNLFSLSAAGASSKIEFKKIQVYNSNPTICEGDTFTLGKNFYTKSGIYYDTLESYYGCDSIVKTSLQLDTPKDIFPHSDTSFCFENGGEFLLDGGLASEYLWQPSMETGRYQSIVSEGKYFLGIIDSWGCKSTDSIDVLNICRMTVFVPNAFAPNGKNIIFKAYGQSIRYIELNIFSSWGELIYECNGGEETSWNGYFNGVLCPVGNYYYWIKAYGMNGEIKNLYGLVQLLK